MRVWFATSNTTCPLVGSLARYSEHWLALLGLAITDRQIATFFGVHVATVYAWKAQFPEFHEAVGG